MPLSLWKGGSAIPLVALAFAAAGGCSHDGRVSVTGTVRYADGSPVTFGSIRFEGERRSGFAHIQPDGRFTIQAGGGTRGLFPGRYAVVIDSTAGAPVWDDAKGTFRYSKPLVADRYASPDTSGLVCEVAGSTVFDAVVEPPPN